jgi:hypothetical protein
MVAQINTRTIQKGCFFLKKELCTGGREGAHVYVYILKHPYTTFREFRRARTTENSHVCTTKN